MGWVMLFFKLFVQIKLFTELIFTPFKIKFFKRVVVKVFFKLNAFLFNKFALFFNCFLKFFDENVFQFKLFFTWTLSPLV